MHDVALVKTTTPHFIQVESRVWVGNFSRQNNLVDIILILFLLQIRGGE